VTLIKLAKDEKLVGLERVQEPSEVEGEELEGEAFDGEELDGEVANLSDSGESASDLQADAASDEEEAQD